MLVVSVASWFIVPKLSINDSNTYKLNENYLT